MEIYTTKEFDKQFRKLPMHIQELALVKKEIFQIDAFDARLSTHKLHGKDSLAWAFKINQAYRIKFAFSGNDEAVFLEIGTHGIYR